MANLTTEETALRLGVSTRRARQLAEELKLPRFGRQFVITEKDIRRMAARKTQRGPARKEKK
jgi:hypothetical protein